LGLWPRGHGFGGMEEAATRRGPVGDLETAVRREVVGFGKYFGKCDVRVTAATSWPGGAPSRPTRAGVKRAPVGCKRRGAFRDSGEVKEVTHLPG